MLLETDGIVSWSENMSNIPLLLLNKIIPALRHQLFIIYASFLHSIAYICSHNIGIFYLYIYKMLDWLDSVGNIADIDGNILTYEGI